MVSPYQACYQQLCFMQFVDLTQPHQIDIQAQKTNRELPHYPIVTNQTCNVAQKVQDMAQGYTTQLFCKAGQVFWSVHVCGW